MRRTTADIHDLLAAERFLAAENRLAGTFGRIEEAVAPLLRAMRAAGRTTYATDPEHGAVWGHAFLRPPYAPLADAEWFVAWGLRFPDGGGGWDGAEPPLPRGPHAVVAVGASGEGASGEPGRRPSALPRERSSLLPGWSALEGEAAFLAAALPLSELPAGADAMAEALAGWTLARLEELRAALPDLAAG
ncbi:MAG: hypothetical protein ICV73_07725 [Acetobacteraceae bacterium]|nr:hypothetical protein [Acetobacteraceae bacterium]